MRKFAALIFLLMLWPCIARAQSSMSGAGNATIVHFTTDPTGTACSSNQIAVNDSVIGAFYGCWSNVFAAITGSGSSGLSGMTAGQVPIAATASTVTSSKVLAGSGAGITTGPTTAVSTDFAAFSSTAGQIADSGIPDTAAGLTAVIQGLTGCNTVAFVYTPQASDCVAQGGGSAFSAITGSTNTTAAMVLGTGASLTVSGSGTNNATSLGGATFAAPGAIGGGTPSTGAFTTLSASSTVSGTGFSSYLASPPAIGGTVAAAGTFTSVAVPADGTHPGGVQLAGNTTLPSLTANTITLLGPPNATPTAWSLQVPTAIPTTGDLFDCVVTSTNCVLTDSGVLAANVVTAASNGTTKQICTVTSSNKACTYIDFPDVKIVPAANCTNTTAGGGWTTNATLVAACGAALTTAHTNNLNGVLQGTPSVGTAVGYFDFELPGDWDTSVKPYIAVYYGSGENTTGTVIWTISTACTKQDGSVTDDPSWIAESAMGTQTMAAKNRMWSQNAQVAGAMTNCIAGSSMFVKLALSGTAGSSINVSKATITVPRLLTVQAN